MVEKITIYDLKKPETAIPMNRNDFYSEQTNIFLKTGKPTKACEIADVIFFTERKEIILQKRSLTKNHNPGLIDKSIGGHVSFGDLPFYTVMVETVQELRVPSIVLRTDEDFTKTFKLLEDYLDNIAIIKQIDKKIFFLNKIIKGKKITIANNVDFFLGIYSGATKPVDGEASGVLYYKLDSLRKKMRVNPNIFTHDLIFFIDHYKKEIDNFLNSFK